jgi:membrane-associated phospholipid phosphatase
MNRGGITPRYARRMDAPAGPATAAPPTRLLFCAAGGAGVTALAAWVAVSASAHERALFRWFNDPPQPLESVLAAANPLLRPLPLAALVVVLAAWLAFSTPAGRARVLLCAQGASSAALAWVLGTLLKLVVDTPRPLAALAGVSTHGYPQTPRGAAFPSTHTAVAVALAVAVWALVRTAQRIVLAAVAVLVALNRMYIGAHWPVDVVGGAALGVTAACLVLLVSARVQATRADAARPGR